MMLKVLMRGLACPLYEWQERLFLEAEEGAPYQVQLTNPMSVRVLVVLAADGINVVDGRPARFDGPGLVVAPGQEIVMPGFVADSSSCLPFRFAKSGVVGAAIFCEDPTSRPPPDRWTDHSTDLEGPRETLYTAQVVFHRATKIPQKVYKIQYGTQESLLRWRVPIPSSPPDDEAFPAEGSHE